MERRLREKLWLDLLWLDLLGVHRAEITAWTPEWLSEKAVDQLRGDMPVCIMCNFQLWAEDEKNRVAILPYVQRPQRTCRILECEVAHPERAPGDRVIVHCVHEAAHRVRAYACLLHSMHCVDYKSARSAGSCV